MNHKGRESTVPDSHMGLSLQTFVHPRASQRCNACIYRNAIEQPKLPNNGFRIWPERIKIAKTDREMANNEIKKMMPNQPLEWTPPCCALRRRSSAR